MVTNTNKIPVSRDRKAALLAFTPAVLTAAAPTYLPIDSGLVMPVLCLLTLTVIFGLAVLWRQAGRQILPAQAPETGRGPSAPLVLRTPLRAEGPAGLLRDLARTAGEQDGIGIGASAIRGSKLELVPQVPPARFPEPSLLPSLRRPSAEDSGRTGLILQAFETDRIELHLQPIVSLPETKIRFYEVLARLRLADGTLLGPSEFLPILECAGRASAFDRRIVTRSMVVARHLMKRGSDAIVGVNLTAQSIAEPGFLWSLAGLIDAEADLVGKIVLELPQHCWRHLDAEHRAALAALSERGVPFSLDRAADLRFDAHALAELGLRFMKLPADLMIEAAERTDGRYAGPELDVRDFASTLRRQGIRLIAERVDADEMVPALCDLGVPLAQGFAFAAPRPVRPEIFGELPQTLSLDEEPMRLRRAG
jgi:cyclic-di-GMP phosphodiesterase TipF (flagellum assembly factor)